VCEAARDGLPYADVVAAGHGALGEGDVLDGVRGLVPRIEVEALFADGRHLVVLDDPLGATPTNGRAQLAEPPIVWLDGAPVRLEVVNESRVPIAVTSHLHFFEVNRRLRFDRAQAWGMRLAVPARTKVFFAPGEPLQVALTPIGGRRVVRGHSELVDGELDAPGARDAALAAARAQGYAGA
jgi:urease subunit gamma/beta